MQLHHSSGLVFRMFASKICLSDRAKHTNDRSTYIHGINFHSRDRSKPADDRHKRLDDSVNRASSKAKRMPVCALRICEDSVGIN